MALLFVILALISLYGIRFSSYRQDYISMESTNAIKGIFAVIILFSHMCGYIVLGNSFLDTSFLSILRHLGQLMVAPYLFFSGYGILESVKRKPNYTSTFPRKRILKTLIHFDIAVISYLLLNFLIGPRYPLSSYLLCWIGWESIGNSNWFVFVILMLYILSFLSLTLSEKVCGKNESKLVVIAITVTAMSILLWYVLRFSGKGSWWYDTILSFPLGMWFSIYKPRFDALMKRNAISWLLVVCSVVVTGIWHTVIGNDHLGICACLFSLSIIFIMTKVDINNKVLQWLGAHAFAIYIMQRWPMNLFERMGWNLNSYLFALISIPFVLLIAWGYHKLLNAADRQL